MANGNGFNGKSRWALLPIGVVGMAIAGAVAYGKIQGHIDAELHGVKAQVETLVDVLPDIRDRLIAIETDVRWIKKGLNNNE